MTFPTFFTNASVRIILAVSMLTFRQCHALWAIVTIPTTIATIHAGWKISQSGECCIPTYTLCPKIMLMYIFKFSLTCIYLAWHTNHSHNFHIWLKVKNCIVVIQGFRRIWPEHQVYLTNFWLKLHINASIRVNFFRIWLFICS